MTSASLSLTPLPLTHEAIEKGVERGREGRGSVYVFAVLSSAKWGVNCNWNAMLTSPYALIVSSVTHIGFPGGGDPGSCISVVAPGSGDGVGLVTCDVGDSEHLLGKCNTNFGKDDAASSAAIVSGIVALMIQANPSLTWRDIRRILIETAHSVGETGWRRNGAGLLVHPHFGFGMVNAQQAVHSALSLSLSPQPHRRPMRVTTGIFSSTRSF